MNNNVMFTRKSRPNRRPRRGHSFCVLTFLFSITEVDNKDAKNQVILTATAAEWKDVAGTFDLEFGKVEMSESDASQLHERGWFDPIGDVIDKGKDIAGDAIDKGKDIVGDIKEGAGDVIDKGKDIAGDAIDKGKDIVGDIKDGAEDVIDKGKDIAGDVGGAIKDGAESIYHGIADLGDGSLEKSTTFPISVGKKNTDVLLFQDFRK